jgi:hypothetical protein
MCKEFSQIADFALVYIGELILNLFPDFFSAEAHACNEWSIHSSRCTWNGQVTVTTRLE